VSEKERSRQEDAGDRAYDVRLVRRLAGYLRPYRLGVGGSIALLLVGAPLELVGPWITKRVLDEVVPQRDERLLLLLAGTFAGALVFAFVLRYVQAILTTWLAQRVMFDIRVELFSHLQRLSLRFFDANPVGRLMTRVTNDVEVLNEVFGAGIVTIFGDVFVLLFVAAAMFRMDWRLALIALTIFPFIVVATLVFRARMRGTLREIRVLVARINAYLQERVGGMRVVQLFGREEQSLRHFREINDEHQEAHLRFVTSSALFLPVLEVLTTIALALILWYGGVQALGGAVTVGTIAAFLQYARRFFAPIQDMAEKFNILQGAMASSERIFALLDTEPEIRDAPDPLHLPAKAAGRIEFRDVWFRYGEGDPWVLKGVSFTARPGERVAIVGATGAGKSTIINLLMRFYEPEKGEILFDGVPIQRVPVRELRGRVGLVLQDVFLFSGEVSYNVRLGRADISDERIRRAAERVGADPFIRRLPGGYEQPLGERGISLSVGERQLVSFTRALAFDPPVLVLDEATSSVDSELEAQIERALGELMKGRTSLVIAHRLSTIQSADQILVLHHGEIRERGTHAELLRQGGLYARLHELQFVRAELAHLPPGQVDIEPEAEPDAEAAQA
jgi:ATP-binding cassette subfamily B protein